MGRMGREGVGRGEDVQNGGVGSAHVTNYLFWHVSWPLFPSVSDSHLISFLISH
jgi:hypothetical protein